MFWETLKPKFLNKCNIANVVNLTERDTIMKMKIS